MMSDQETVCERIREIVVPYLDGELSEGEQSQLESHMSACFSCREELALARKKLAEFIETYPQSIFAAQAKEKLANLPSN